MENLEIIKEKLQQIGINDNMILPDTINISGEFIVEDGVLKRIKRIKITVDFEVQIGEMITTNL